MQIIRAPKYLHCLDTILDFIAQDSFQKSMNFLNGLDKAIKNLVNMPYKFRKSYYYNKDEVRDLIFKGYTIPYLIDKEKNQIVILDIFKWSNR